MAEVGCGVRAAFVAAGVIPAPSLCLLTDSDIRMRPLCSKVSNKFGEMSQRRCIGSEALIKPPSQYPRPNPLRSTAHTGRHDFHTRPPTRLGRNSGDVRLRMDKAGTRHSARWADDAWKCGTIYL